MGMLKVVEPSYRCAIDASGNVLKALAVTATSLSPNRRFEFGQALASHMAFAMLEVIPEEFKSISQGVGNARLVRMQLQSDRRRPLLYQGQRLFDLCLRSTENHKNVSVPDHLVYPPSFSP